MDIYHIQLSGSCQISTIRWNLALDGLHVSCQIGSVLITTSTSVRQSTNAACQLSDRQSLLQEPINDPRWALMCVEVVFTERMFYRNTQTNNVIIHSWRSCWKDGLSHSEQCFSTAVDILTRLSPDNAEKLVKLWTVIYSSVWSTDYFTTLDIYT